MAAVVLRSRRNDWGALAAGVALLMIPPIAAYQGPQQISASALGAASATLSHFAQALAASHVPAGFVIRAADEIAPRGYLQRAKGTVTLEEVLAAFHHAHPDYHARRAGQVVSVRPRQSTACDAVLQVPVGPAKLAGKLGTVLEEVARLVNPSIPSRPPGGGGDLGSVMSRPEDPVVIPSMPVAAVTFDRVTFEQALNVLVQTTPGVVWIVDEYSSDAVPKCQLRAAYGDHNGVTVPSNLIR